MLSDATPSGPDRTTPPILVCPLSRVAEMIETHAPERIVSLLDPGFTFPQAGPAYADRHLRLSFHDIHVPGEAQVMPSTHQVDVLIAFLAAWQRTAPLLIHCRAGIGRSTAAAYIAACLHNAHTDELDIAVALRRASPLARPNEWLVAQADRALGRQGRMSRAIADTGRGLPWIFDDVDEGVPFGLPATYV